MFKITDAEKLRDAYTLLAFIRDDVPTTTAEQKSGMAAFMVSIKKEIRAYNNRPAPDSRIVEEHGIDGYIALYTFPEELASATRDEAEEWFDKNCRFSGGGGQYDCTGEKFTQWRYVFRRNDRWLAYHSVAFDV